MNPEVDFYFDKAKKWQNELCALRQIVSDSCTELVEECKWGVPCYTYHKSNVVLIHDFKGYCSLLFIKGALLKDADGILIQQTKNVQAARQMRFTNCQSIEQQKSKIKAYIKEALAIEMSGLTIDFKPTQAYTAPEEWTAQLNANSALQKAFAALTPGRQRAYLLYFDAAKQAKTRIARIEKNIPNILAGKGLNE
jgi:uncharacterized protein YdeI (YjbR/CyaY-like superfamily)